jgi:hypothetical protein
MGNLSSDMVENLLFLDTIITYWRLGEHGGERIEHDGVELHVCVRVPVRLTMIDRGTRLRNARLAGHDR